MLSPSLKSSDFAGELYTVVLPCASSLSTMTLGLTAWALPKAASAILVRAVSCASYLPSQQVMGPDICGTAICSAHVICPWVPDCVSALKLFGELQLLQLTTAHAMEQRSTQPGIRLWSMSLEASIPHQSSFVRHQWKDLSADRLLFRNPTTCKMSSTNNNDVKTSVPIFDGSNYNVWVDQMKFWLQS